MKRNIELIGLDDVRNVQQFSFACNASVSIATECESCSYLCDIYVTFLGVRLITLLLFAEIVLVHYPAAHLT